MIDTAELKALTARLVKEYDVHDTSLESVLDKMCMNFDLSPWQAEEIVRDILDFVILPSYPG